MGENGHISVAVCLVTHNRRALLLNALASLKKQTFPVSEIVLVDNCSSDGSSAEVRTVHPEVKIIRLHENKGCPPARNIAMANARSEYIANLDDDGEFAPDAIENALGVFEKFPDTGIVMMDIIEEGESRFPKFSDEQIIPNFSAGCCIIKSSVLEKCGFFSDDIFRQGEEYDFSIRVLGAGWQMRFSRFAKMYHYPPVALRSLPRIMYLGALAKSLAVVKYAPGKYVVPDLVRRFSGYSFLFLKSGRLDLIFKLFFNFFYHVPGALRSRDVQEVGYPLSRKLHRQHVE